MSFSCVEAATPPERGMNAHGGIHPAGSANFQFPVRGRALDEYLRCSDPLGIVARYSASVEYLERCITDFGHLHGEQQPVQLGRTASVSADAIQLVEPQWKWHKPVFPKKQRDHQMTGSWGCRPVRWSCECVNVLTWIMVSCGFRVRFQSTLGFGT